MTGILQYHACRWCRKQIFPCLPLWKENRRRFRMERHCTGCLVMNLMTLLCIGATGNISSLPLWQEQKALPGESYRWYYSWNGGFLAAMRKWGIGIYSTGGETADMGDLIRTIIVDSTVFTRMKRSEVTIMPKNHCRRCDVDLPLQDSNLWGYL